jgi:translation initiation factor 2 subunit 1
MPLACRFYANEFPEMEDTVIAKVTKIADMGAYVTLTEYNDKGKLIYLCLIKVFTEGMILLSELSRRRIRSVNKLIRVGRSECVVVIRVDEKKGYIDLSKRRVYSRDLLKCEDRFSRAKAINSILCQVASKLGYTENSQLEELYKKTAWHFDEKMGKKAASSEIFKKALTDPTVFDECDISEEIKNKLLDEIKKKLTPQALKIRSDIEVTCFNIEGIEAVKAALLKGKKHSTELMPIEVSIEKFVYLTFYLDQLDCCSAFYRYYSDNGSRGRNFGDQ